jgi:hypothetical protein
MYGMLLESVQHFVQVSTYKIIENTDKGSQRVN